MSLSISADIGGTFTDVVCVDDSDGAVVVAKSATVADDPVRGIAAALASTGAQLADGARFLHGTTTGINTLLQRRGSKVGLITTAGFRDVLAIGDASWPPYRITWQPPEPLVPRHRRLEVHERILADGSVEEPLDPEEVLARVDELLGHGAEAIAICLYNAYVEPRHEQEAGAAIAARHPELDVVLSHQLTRRYREMERTATTVVEAYLRPRMRRYFDDLNRGLAGDGFAGKLFITASDGGVMSGGQARERALRTLVSGCAGGVSGAAVVAQRAGWGNVLAIDMGGTSFDAAVIRGGQPEMVQEAQLAGVRFLVPMIDLATIGAGGGSIAGVDAAGGLSVGPESAGAVPGPACYGRGGARPTFTDAALLAGLLPVRLGEGQLELDAGAAAAAIVRDVGSPLGLTAQQAAAGIIAVTEARMAQTLEQLTIGRGLDPRDFTIVAYGGSGPVVAARLAAELGITRVVVPRHPGAFSAFGMQLLDVVHEVSRTRVDVLDADTAQTVEAVFAELAGEALGLLRADDIEDDLVQLLRFVEMRYDGQEHTLLVPLLEHGGEAELRTGFHHAHEATFGFRIDGDIQVVGYRLRAIGRLPKAGVDDAAPPTSDGDEAPGTRTVHGRDGASDWPVWRRESLSAGLEGPAVVEEATATTVVPRGWRAFVHPHGHLVLEAGDA